MSTEVKSTADTNMLPAILSVALALVSWFAYVGPFRWVAEAEMSLAGESSYHPALGFVFTTVLFYFPIRFLCSKFAQKA